MESQDHETRPAWAKSLKFEADVESGKFTVRPRSLLADLERVVMQGEDHGISTGWTNLDQYYTVRKGELCVISGVPAHGKSEFLDALMVNLARHHGWKFAMFSPENKPFVRHLRKLMEKHSGQTLRKEENGKVSLASASVLSSSFEFCEKHFRWIDLKGEDVKLSNITQWFAHEILHNSVDGVVLDPWGDIEHRRPVNLSETEYISHMLTLLREFARLHDVAFWIIAHPAKIQRDRKTGDYPKPSLWDISGSAHWRNRADVGIVVYRADTRRHDVEIDVQKVRFKTTGKPGSAFFLYNYETGVFSPDYKGGE